MTAWLTLLRTDLLLQARHGFYAASVFLVLTVGGLLLMIPEAARGNAALWVPALFVVNLPITTLFFVAGLILLEREEGTLTALGVAPCGAGRYLGIRVLTLTTLGVLETLLVVVIAFDVGTAGWIAAGAAGLGVFYTACGAGLSARYASVNELILPASVFVTFLLLPLLAHFGVIPRALVLAHPVEPALTLVRAGYVSPAAVDAGYGVVGSLAWGLAAWQWGTWSVARAMRDTRASGGR
jgi:fluoroquinolone transport system permease protein